MNDQIRQIGFKNIIIMILTLSLSISVYYNITFNDEIKYIENQRKHEQRALYYAITLPKFFGSDLDFADNYVIGEQWHDETYHFTHTTWFEYENFTKAIHYNSDKGWFNLTDPIEIVHFRFIYNGEWHWSDRYIIPFNISLSFKQDVS